MDLAHIGLRADSTEIDKAGKELDELTTAAGKAGNAADKFGNEAQQASTATSKMNAQVSSAVDRFNVMGKVLATLGAVLTTAFAAVSLRNFISATTEADAVQIQLAAALKSTAGASGQTVATLNEHAAALQKVTTYGDEAINSAQELLLTFTKIGGETFPRATEAVLDYATRMKVDLRSAAVQVGKALNDPTIGMTALSRAGVTFSQTQKDTVKAMQEANNLAGAQALILRELEMQMGGAAKAARETLGGAMISLRNAWGDLFELGKSTSEGLRIAIEALIVAIQNPGFVAFVQLVGAGMFGAFELAVMGATLLANGISLIANNIDLLMPFIVAATTALAIMVGPAVIGAIASLTLAIGSGLVSAVVALNAAILANPVVAFTAAVAALLYYLLDWEKVIENLIYLWGKLVETIGVALDALGVSTGLAARGLEIQINAKSAAADLKQAGIDMKNNLFNGAAAGGEEGGRAGAPHLAKGVEDGAKTGAAALKAAQEAAVARYAEMNGKQITQLGDVFGDGGKYIYNQVTGAVSKAGDQMSTGIKTGGEAAGGTLESSMVAGAQKAGAVVYNSIESAFATLAPIYDVIAAQNMTNRREWAKTAAEVGKLDAEAQKARAEAEQIRRGATSGLGGGGGGGSSSGYRSSSSSSSDALNMFDNRQNVNVAAPNVSTVTSIQNVIDPNMALDSIDTNAGHERIVNVIKYNREELRAILGGV